MALLRTGAIDFDGVIHKYSKGWQDGTIYDDIMEGCLDAIHTLMKHYSVFILSTRNTQQIYNWLLIQTKSNKLFDIEIIPEHTKFWNKVGCLGITNRKLPAILYLDDRAIKFTTWNKFLEGINNGK